MIVWIQSTRNKKKKKKNMPVEFLSLFPPDCIVLLSVAIQVTRYT